MPPTPLLSRSLSPVPYPLSPVTCFKHDGEIATSWSATSDALLGRPAVMIVEGGLCGEGGGVPSRATERSVVAHPRVP